MSFAPFEINGNIPLEVAGSVSAVVFGDDKTFAYYFNIEDENLVGKCYKTSKYTLLHVLIEIVCTHSFSDIMESEEDLLAANIMKSWMDSISVDYSDIPEPTSDDLHKCQKYADSIQKRFGENAIKTIAEATFIILYNNKDFLFKFNQRVTEQIKKLKKKDHPEYLEEDGKVKRYSPPTWLKEGVAFRDHGRCQECGTDLTAIFHNGNSTNLDHIIPLNQGGSNDPTNFQIMCEHCNKSKSDRSFAYRNTVIPFWKPEG